MDRKVKFHKILYGGRKIEIVENGIHKEPVDALIVPTTADFSIDNPAIGEALTQAIGSRLKVQIEKCSQKYKKLKPTCAVVSKTSSIAAKYLIFCNISQFSGLSDSDSCKQQLQLSIQNSLNEASKFGFKAVGIPTIGKNFPVPYECEAVLKGIVEFHFASPKSPIHTIAVIPLDEDSLVSYSAEMAHLE